MKKINIPLWIIIVLFSVIYGFWSVNRHNRFQTDAVDLAIFDQPLWHYSRFESPRSTVKYNQYPGEHILGDHFHPTLILLAPLYWIWNDVRMLLIAQAIISVLSVWPIYQIAKMKTGSRPFPLALSFSYLTFIGLQTAIDYDFHETTLSILPFSFAAYFLLKNNYKFYFLSLLLAIFTKEDMPLFAAMLGLLAVLKLRKFRIGALTVFFGVTIYFVVTQFIIPYFKHDRFAYEELDPRLGKTTPDLIRSAVTNPLLVLNVLFLPLLKTKTMLNLLASFAFLPLLSPVTLLLTLPNLASRFLTGLSQRWLLRFQYSVVLTPMLALGVIFGLENLKKVKFFNRNFGKVLLVSSFMLIASPVIQTYRTNGPFLRILNPSSYKWEPRFKINNDLISLIPRDPNVSVMAQSSFVPHLSHRYKIFRFEDNLIDKSKPEYVLMSADESSDPPYVRKDLERKIEILRKNPFYDILYWDGVRLLMKVKKA